MSKLIAQKDLPDTIRDKVTLGQYVSIPISAKVVGFLAEISHAFPEYSYVALETDGWGDGRHVNKFSVMSGNQLVGSVKVEARYRRREAEEAYTVIADDMAKRRSAHTTKHLKLAMKTIREHFKPTPVDARAQDMVEQIKNRMHRMLRSADTNLSSMLSLGAEAVIKFLSEYNSMEIKPSTLPPALESSLGSKWRDNLNDARIAKSVNNNFNSKQGVCIRIESDGALSTYDLATSEFAEHKSTYGLPTNYQEKITMLKLMDECQPIEHVGVWFEVMTHSHSVRSEHKYFFLVAGETYTDC